MRIFEIENNINSSVDVFGPRIGLIFSNYLEICKRLKNTIRSSKYPISNVKVDNLTIDVLLDHIHAIMESLDILLSRHHNKLCNKFPDREIEFNNNLLSVRKYIEQIYVDMKNTKPVKVTIKE